LSEEETTMKIMILLVVVMMLPIYAGGQEIYRWIDEKGTTHFADDFNLVPEKYRHQIQKRRPSLPPDTPAKPTEPTEQTKVAPERKDLLGRGEEWWRAKMKEWTDKLQAAQKNYELAQENLKQKEKELAEPKIRPDSVKRKLKAEIKELEEKVKERERERDEAKNMVEKVLPKEAEDYQADPAWLKPKE